MFEPFSKGYYLGRLYLQPHEGDRVVMHREHHERINEQLYATGEGIERLDLPLVMKIGTAHLPVHSEEGIPERTVALPEETFPEIGIENPPTLSEVLLAKADRAAQLIGLDEQLPAAGV